MRDQRHTVFPLIPNKFSTAGSGMSVESGRWSALRTWVGIAPEVVHPDLRTFAVFADISYRSVLIEAIRIEYLLFVQKYMGGFLHKSPLRQGFL